MRNTQRAYLPLKRSIDILGSLLGICILSPLLLLLFIITNLTSKGPAIFKQERAGIYQKSFVIYKFRSMKDGVPSYLAAESISLEKQKEYTTKWGRFMRKTSLDELPQLFNILKGDMSFIGPRPGLTVHGEPELALARASYVPSAFDVKPGLSGYSQITLKRSNDVELRAKWDSYYVLHLSFWLDIKLFFLSLLWMLRITK